MNVIEEIYKMYEKQSIETKRGISTFKELLDSKERVVPVPDSKESIPSTIGFYGNTPYKEESGFINWDPTPSSIPSELEKEVIKPSKYWPMGSPNLAYTYPGYIKNPGTIGVSGSVGDGGPVGISVPVEDRGPVGCEPPNCGLSYYAGHAGARGPAGFTLESIAKMKPFSPVSSK